MSDVVSVVLPTYNGERYLERQLASVLDQTRSPDTIVLSDDGSTDATLAIARRLAASAAAHDTEIRILEHTARLGPVQNLERAIRATAREGVIFLCDQDDEWLPTKVERMLARFAQAPDARVVFTDGLVMSDDPALDGRSLWTTAGFNTRRQRDWAHDPLSVLVRVNVMTGAAAAARADFLHSVLPFPEGGWHDLSLAVLAAATGRVEAMPDQLIHYRLHASNAAGFATGTRRDRVLPADEQRRQLDRQIAHWIQLRDRAAALAAGAHALHLFDAKTAHLRARRALPAQRVRRVPDVAREVWRGGYRRYAAGWFSVIRDLTGP